MATWNTIEEQVQTAHNNVQNVLSSQTTNTGWKSHKTAIIAASFGLVLMGGSFFIPADLSFKADLLVAGLNNETEQNPFLTETATDPEIAAIDDSFQSEAESFDITPVTTNTEVADVAKSTIAESLAQIPAADLEAANITEADLQKIEKIAQTVVNAFEKPTTEEINPFLSLQNTPNPVEEFHGASILKDEESSEEEFGGLIEPMDTAADITTEIEEMTPFKANSNTFDTQTTPESIDVNVLDDPLANVINTITGNTEDEVTTQETTQVTTEFGTQRYTGILGAGIVNKASGMPFGFWLHLENGEKIKMNTKRDLRSVIGKEITIEIEGTFEDFVLKKVIFDKSKYQLAQSGPEMAIALTALVALALAWFRRRV